MNNVFNERKQHLNVTYIYQLSTHVNINKTRALFKSLKKNEEFFTLYFAGNSILTFNI